MKLPQQGSLLGWINKEEKREKGKRGYVGAVHSSTSPPKINRDATQCVKFKQLSLVDCMKSSFSATRNEDVNSYSCYRLNFCASSSKEKMAPSTAANDSDSSNVEEVGEEKRDFIERCNTESIENVSRIVQRRRF